jgi:hypothetical protein
MCVTIKRKTVEGVRHTVNVGIPGSEDGLHGSALVLWSKMSIQRFCMTVTYEEALLFHRLSCRREWR